MPNGKKLINPLGVGLLVLVLTNLPYLIANQAAGIDHQFGGFLFNPLDSHSYLSKMTQGWYGSWRFQLAYTAEPGEGAYLFLFYVALGHLARVTGQSLLTIFHFARVLSGLLLLATIYFFFQATVPGRRGPALAFLWAGIGGGLGWLTVPFGGFTADFWVAEAFPFLSMFANPHFPLGLALLLLILNPNAGSKINFRGNFPHLLLALALSVVAPFGVIIALACLAFVAGVDSLRRSASPWAFQRLVWVGMGGVPMLAYDLWVVYQNPVLAGWNAQNLTPTPPLWDLLLSFSPALALWLVGVIMFRRTRPAAGVRLLAIWGAVVLILIYLPVNLQRRLLMGFYIPLVGLGAWVVDRWVPSRFFGLATVILLVSIPTNLLVVLAGLNGAQTRDPALYITSDEARALDWITTNTPRDSLILASPETGLRIPAYTGRRVIYGHPFETVDADRQKARLIAFFQTNTDSSQADLFLQDQGVDYIFWGPREQILAGNGPGFSTREVYRAGSVRIYVPGS